jgi:hypothetical protein
VETDQHLTAAPHPDARASAGCARTWYGLL